MRTRGAAELGIRSATSLTFDSVQKSMRDNSEDWLRELGLDLFRARQAREKYNTNQNIGSIMLVKTLVTFAHLLSLYWATHTPHDENGHVALSEPSIHHTLN